ncbi:MAG: OsmC family protein [Porticoccaceae bacterium]|nr:OsmC family protein [Pseudomonadales bacterium]MCP5171039.1 OsmC family protein [Pseudomonadales bacterium]MCP5301722.1 OsmC family protein [Pseudomonadales bacterium]
MQPLPHFYLVEANASATGALSVAADGLADIEVSPPVQYGGSGDDWSPESLLMASVASCLILSFRAVASASKFPWLSIECEAQGKLDKVGNVTSFTDITTTVALTISADSDAERAGKLLEKAEQICLINNSLSAEKHFEYSIVSKNGTE